MNAYELADQVEMWGEDLLALNMKGGIPVIEGAKMLRQQAKYITELEKTLEQIREGCQNVKEDVGGNNEQIRALATLVIRDCNLTLKKAQEK